jgi:hypothetical protein
MMDMKFLTTAYDDNDELTSTCIKFSDISYVLPMMFVDILMKAYNEPVDNVVELGTRQGESSVALYSAVCHINKHREEKATFTSVEIDKEQFPPVRERLKKVGDLGYWKSIVGDSVKVTWTDPIDFLLIDTSHEEDQTLLELLKWSPYIKPKGTIWLHDTQSCCGVRRAALKWLDSQPGDTWDWFELPTYAGLGWLRRR